MFGMQTAYLAKKIITYFQIFNGFSRPTKNFLICEKLRVWEVRTRNLNKKTIKQCHQEGFCDDHV